MWMCLVGSGVQIAVWLTLHEIWTGSLHYRWPMPLGGGVIAPSMTGIVMLIIGWCVLPSKAHIRVRYVSVIACFSLMVIMLASYVVLLGLMVMVAGFFQALLVPVVLVWREIFNRLMMRVATWGHPVVDDLARELCIDTIVNTSHACFLAVVLCGSATMPTTIALIAADTANNIHLLRRASRPNSGSGLNEQGEAMSAATKMVLIEILECIVPSQYLLFLLASFYSPNAMHLGSIRATFFHHVAIDDLGSATLTLVLLIALDTLSLAFSSIYLWRSKRVSVRKLYLWIDKECGPVIVSFICGSCAMFPCLVVASCGIDMTFKFEWLRGGYTLT